jgi:hypothetical protein
VSDDVVTITVGGEGVLPPTEGLVAAIRGTDPTVGVDVRVLDAKLVHAAPPLG